MLETPLSGRFQGEDRRLIFGPPREYDLLVNACIVGGGLGSLYSLLAARDIVPRLPSQEALSLFFPLVGLAGVWALLSLQRIVFDLKERTYMRRDGPGFILTTRRGTIDEIEAITLLAEHNMTASALALGKGVTYRLVMHWKGMQQPIVVLQTDSRHLAPSDPMNAGAGPILQLGLRYAKALQLPLFDNSHVASPRPVPLF